MSAVLRVFLHATFLFFILTLSAEAAVVNATWNSATTIPVTASSYTATGNTVNFTLNFAPSTGTNLTVVNNTALPFISGAFSNLAQGQAVALSYGGGTYNFVANYFGGTGNDLVLVWANNRAFAWGSDVYGQLGDGGFPTNQYIMVPVAASGVMAGKTITALAQGAQHCLALCSDGTLAAWGSGGSGQLGNYDPFTSYNTPTAVNTTSTYSALYGKTVVAIAAGYQFSMALCSDGTIATWGDNTYGQLGNGSATQGNGPVAVNTESGFSALYGKTVVAISAGLYHCMALCSDGIVVSWGYNGYGQLGNNSTTQSTYPVAVSTVSGTSALYGKNARALAAGGYHSMVLCSDGTVVSWGYNTSGQLGNNSTSQTLVPVAVNALNGTSALYGKNVTALAAGYDFSLTLCSDGTVASWGDNNYGQLGNNTTTDSSVPVLVNTVNGISALYGKTVVAIAAGWSNGSRAMCSDGTLTSWGGGYLGDNTSQFSSVPVVVLTTPLQPAERLVNPPCGSNTAMSMILAAEPPPVVSTLVATAVTGTSATTNGTVNANNGAATVIFDYGTTTAYGSTVVATPSPVTGSIATAVSASISGLTPGTTYHCRVRAGGSLATDQTFITLSNNASLAGLAFSSGTFALTPAFSSSTTSYTIGTLSGTSSINLTPTLSESHAAMTVNGMPVASGSASGAINLSYGDNVITTVVTAQDGTTVKTYTITATRAVPGVWPVTYSSATDVPVTVNGFNATGGTINLSLSYAPVTGTNLTVVKNTGLGFITGNFANLSHGQMVALSYNGVSYKFVANYYGGTGNDLVLVWAGNRAFSWGSNTNGQVGDGTTTMRSVMVPVSTAGVLSGKTIIGLAKSSTHSLALCSDGTVAAWGYNAFGQLGNNTNTSSSVPVAVNAANGVSALYGKTVVAVATGDTFSMALCSNGTVVTWGQSDYGQLGNNSYSSANVPVAVNTASGVSALFGKTVVGIAAGASHCLARCSDGKVVAWGFNYFGGLGNNSATSASPVPVLVNTTSGTSSLYGKSAAAIAAGGSYSMALCTDGTVSTWGNNSNGQLGNGSTTQSLVPVAINTSSGTSALYGKTVVALAAGGVHGMALCSDGSVAAWGDNTYGTLGNNTTTQRTVPVLVNSASGISALYGKTVVAVMAGGYNTASNRVLCADGTLAAWGYNGTGNLGNGGTTNSSVPVTVNISPLAAGEWIVNPASSGNTAQSMALVAEPVPTVTTLAVAALGSTSVTLNGTVNANNGAAVAVSFEYGTTTAYGTTVVANPGSVTSGSATAVSTTLSGLTPNTTYHYRVNGDIYNGADVTFTTLNNDAILSGLAISSGTLSPAFASNTLAYSVVLDSSITSVILTPTANDGNASITVNGQNVVSGSPTGSIPLAAGNNTLATVVTAQDGVTKTTYVLNVACLNAVQSWRQQNFGSNANTGPTADSADYDNDGICNLLEYALNLSPQTASKLPMSTAVNGENYEYTYTRSTAAVTAGTLFTVEWNATLSAASWSSSGVTQTVLSDDGTTQQVKAIIPMNAASKMFIHLSVTPPP